MTNNYQPGDVVYCPMMNARMTIERVNENGTVNTVWFSGFDVKRAELLSENLIPDFEESRQILSD